MKNPILRFWLTDECNYTVSEYSNHGLTTEICFGQETKGIKSIELRAFTDDYHYMGRVKKLFTPDKYISRSRMDLVSVDEWDNGVYYIFVYINNEPSMFAKAELKLFHYLPYKVELASIDNSELLTDDIRQHTIDRTDDYAIPHPKNTGYRKDFKTEDDVTDDTEIHAKGEEEKDALETAIENFIAKELDQHDETDNTTSPEVKETEETKETKDTNEALQPSAEEDLEKMVGLGRLKNELRDARLMAMFEERRRALHLDTTKERRHHMLFLGNPGTGKTTVARLVGRMYHKMGLLSKGHTVETERSKLLGEYIGQTEKNTAKAIRMARGGVLFVDEAYTLVNSVSKENNDFGKEVLNALLTVLTEPEPDMIIILAGYEKQMQTMLNFNPGLKERFPLVFHFEDYTAEELKTIARNLCKADNYTLTPEADNELCRLIERAEAQRDEYFSNGRWVNNLIRHGVIKSMARRVMSAPHRDDDCNLFATIEACDVSEAASAFLKQPAPAPMRIGFTA